jgi:hypothetical protein
MNISPKENILKKIRQADKSTPLLTTGEEIPQYFLLTQPWVEFAEHFNSLLGRFVFCANQAERLRPTAGITTQME